MHIGPKISMTCLALLLALCLAAVANAGGAKPRVKSRIFLESVGPNGAQGMLTSKSPPCRRKRGVTLYMQTSGPSIPTSEPIGGARTKRDGSWRLPQPLGPGTYYATAKAKRTPVLTCPASVSQPQTF